METVSKSRLKGLYIVSEEKVLKCSPNPIVAIVSPKSVTPEKQKTLGN